MTYRSIVVIYAIALILAIISLSGLPGRAAVEVPACAMVAK